MHPYATISKSKNLVPDRVCFDITDSTISQYSEGFRSALQNATQASESEAWSDNFVPSHYEEYAFSITTKEALKLLEKYNFTEKSDEYSYVDTCFFNYHGKQYIIEFVFQKLYSSDTNFAHVNFMENSLGTTISPTPDIAVYQDFNGTVLFGNHLNHDVVLTFTFLQPKSYYGDMPDHITIPVGQSIPYDFNYYVYNSSSVRYQYLIQPDNLLGSVTVNNPHRCLTMEEAKSIYLLVHFTLKFPQHLPDGYTYKCGIYELPNELISLYGNSNISTNGLVSYAGLVEYYKKGALTVEDDRTNSFMYNEMKTREETEKANGTSLPSGLHFTGINGNPATVYSGLDYRDPTLHISDITLYTKEDIFMLSGNFTVDELGKIAESIR